MDLADLMKEKMANGATTPNEKNLFTETKDPAKPPAKAQVVGWPPIRSYRKNIMSQKTTTTTEVAEKTSGSGEAAFVKVCMDRAPYLRKVGLENTRATNSPLMPWPRFSVPSPWGLLVLRVDAAVSAEVAFLVLQFLMKKWSFHHIFGINI